ncbi:MAG: acyl-CoA synthetase [Acidimicrobiales bacterium]
MSDELGEFYPGYHAANRPDHLAVVNATTGETMTFAELDTYANQLSHLLRSSGLEVGDHVAFCMENRTEFLAVAWGCHYAGLYYTAISSRLTSDEAAYIINDCGAKGFITSPYLADVATSIADDIPNAALRLSSGGAFDGYLDLTTELSKQPTTPLTNRREAADMLYSSGTTGRPKGVKLNPDDEPLGTGSPVTTLSVMLFGATPEAIYLSPAPMYHAAPLRFSLSMLRVGATVVMLERFDPEAALAAIEKYQATTSQWVPTMFVRMLKLPEETRAKYDVSSLQVAVHAAAPCPIEVKEKMINWWGPALHEYYAGTEGNGFCYTNSHDWLTHKGTVGKPLTAPVHIVGEDGEEVPTGEEGTVYFASNDFSYHNDSAKTEDARHPNGWSTLGDVGKGDEEGFLYLTDRKAYMIISGGVNIYPQEAENVLTMHPDVIDVAVIGVPNDDFGEEVKAVVQPAVMPADADAAAKLERTLIAYCRGQLADVKCPRSVDFRSELPRHPTGKLYKRLLKDEYWQAADRRI